MSTYSIRNHRLYCNDAAVPFEATVNKSGSYVPRYLIMHYTAGTTADGAVSWFKNPKSEVSAHLVMDRDGSVIQMVPFNLVAWHAGPSFWNGLSSMNFHSIGIEMVNAGKLQRTASGGWLTSTGKSVAPEDVIIAGHKNEHVDCGWHRFTAEQVAAAIAIGIALRQHYHLMDVLGHDDIAPKRKVDPGPAFPLISVQSKIMGRRD